MRIIPLKRIDCDGGSGFELFSARSGQTYPNYLAVSKTKRKITIRREKVTRLIKAGAFFSFFRKILVSAKAIPSTEKIAMGMTTIITIIDTVKTMAESIPTSLMEAVTSKVVIARTTRVSTSITRAANPQGELDFKSFSICCYTCNSLPRVSGNVSINAAPATKNNDVTPKALPTPLRSAIAPTNQGASALTARPML